MVSQHALQVSRPTPRGEVEGSGLGGFSRQTPRGEVEESGLGGLQAHTQGGSQAHTWGGISRPTPGGKLRGLAWGVSRPTPIGGLMSTPRGVSRPTPGGKLRGLAWGGLQANTHRGSPGPHPGGSPGPHWGGGLQAHTWGVHDIPPPRWLLLRAVRILLECILVQTECRPELDWDHRYNSSCSVKTSM